MALAVTACGGGGGGGAPAAVDPNAPVISNLRVSFGPRCMLPTVNLPGTIEVLAFEYTDADGDVRGGVVESTSFFAGGGTVALNAAVPSPGVTITGTTSGTITFAACLRFGNTPSVTEHMKLTDAAGRASNELTLEVPRPAGAPLLPRDVDAAPRKSPEPGR
jgi:hypothetical protein